MECESVSIDKSKLEAILNHHFYLLAKLNIGKIGDEKLVNYARFESTVRTGEEVSNLKSDPNIIKLLSKKYTVPFEP